jgi:hypothetical protein
MMKFLLLNILFLPFMFVSYTIYNPNQTMREQFEAYIEAINNHKIEKSLSFLSDDFQLHFAGSDFSIDKNGMIDVLGWDKGVNGKVSCKNLVVEGDSITGIFTERNDFFKLIGIRELKSKNTYTFDESSLIEKQVYTPLPEQPSFQEKIQPAVTWARKNRPGELEEIYPNNQIQFNEEMAGRWMALLKEWKKATRAE